MYRSHKNPTRALCESPMNLFRKVTWLFRFSGFRYRLARLEGHQVLFKGCLCLFIDIVWFAKVYGIMWPCQASIVYAFPIPPPSLLSMLPFTNSLISRSACSSSWAGADWCFFKSSSNYLKRTWRYQYHSLSLSLSLSLSCVCLSVEWCIWVFLHYCSWCPLQVS